MKRFMTASFLEEDEVRVYTEDQEEEIAKAQNEAIDWVWQFAQNKEEAIAQHFTQLYIQREEKEWKINP